jgi:hypothetical protein
VGRREVAWLIPKGTRDGVLAAFGLDMVKAALGKERIDTMYIVT